MSFGAKQRRKKRMTRKQFESFIKGSWTSHDGDRYRKNGIFKTWVANGMKHISNGTVDLQARSWYELSAVFKVAIKKSNDT